MKAIISIHDVSPYFRKEIEFIIKELKDINKSFLATPLWDGKNLFENDFSMLLAGEEIALHGLTHKAIKRDYLGRFLLMRSSSLKEFYRLDKIQTKDRIVTARKLFEDTFNKTPAGFIPPMWYHNRHTIGTLKDLGFHYTESTTAFVNLQHETNTFSIPICFDFGNNKLLAHLSVFGWKHIFKHLHQPLIRLSIHPADISNGLWRSTLDLIKWMQGHNYTFLQYADLLKR